MNKKLVMTGISRKGEPFKIKTADPRPGTYKKQDFALCYPEYYAELVRAGMPALGDGQSVLITIT